MHPGCTIDQVYLYREPIDFRKAIGGLSVDVVHDVPEADRTCACGTPMVEIGQDISEQLDIVPMQVPRRCKP